MLIRKMRTLLLMSLCILILNSCQLGGKPEDPAAKEKERPSVEKLKNIAYDVRPKSGYTVYLKEMDVYVPWLVLSANYGGHVLLLRRDLLSETMPFTENESGLWDPAAFGGYYKDSSIDTFLNTEFIGRCSPSLR